MVHECLDYDRGYEQQRPVSNTEILRVRPE